MRLLSNKLVRNLVLAFSVTVGGSTVTSVNDDEVRLASEKETSFSCEKTDASSWNTQADMLQHFLSSVVQVNINPTHKVGNHPSGFISINAPQPQSGSGFFISNDGYIITNAHVAKNFKSGEVILYDGGARNSLGEAVSVQLIGIDKPTDLAVLKVDMDQVENCISMDAKTHINYFDDVFAIGHPFRQSYTLTKGIVSMPSRTLLGFPFTDMIQIDAAINPGNSGGPLITSNGDFLGVNMAILSEVGQNSGVSYAIPVSTAVSVAHQLIQLRKVPYSFVGVETVKDHNGLKGALVERVLEHSPAAYAGLKVEDLIVQVNGNNVRDTIDFIREAVPNHSGTVINMSIIREGELLNIPLTVEEGEKYHQRLAAINALRDIYKNKPPIPVLASQ